MMIKNASKKSAQKLNQTGRDDVLVGGVNVGHLGDQLRRRLTTGFGITRIDGEDLRVEKIDKGRVADAGKLKRDAPLLQIFAGTQGQAVAGAEQRRGLGCQHLRDMIVTRLHTQAGQHRARRQIVLAAKGLISLVATLSGGDIAVRDANKTDLPVPSA